MYYVCIMSPLSLSLSFSHPRSSSFSFLLCILSLSFLSLPPPSLFICSFDTFDFSPLFPSLLSFPLSIFPSLSSGLVVSSDDRLGDVVEESQDLKGVWVELGKIWEQID